MFLVTLAMEFAKIFVNSSLFDKLKSKYTTMKAEDIGKSLTAVQELFNKGASATKSVLEAMQTKDDSCKSFSEVVLDKIKTALPSASTNKPAMAMFDYNKVDTAMKDCDK